MHADWRTYLYCPYGNKQSFISLRTMSKQTMTNLNARSRRKHGLHRKRPSNYRLQVDIVEVTSYARRKLSTRIIDNAVDVLNKRGKPPFCNNQKNKKVRNQVEGYRNLISWKGKLTLKNGSHNFGVPGASHVYKQVFTLRESKFNFQDRSLAIQLTLQPDFVQKLYWDRHGICLL